MPWEGCLAQGRGQNRGSCVQTIRVCWMSGHLRTRARKQTLLPAPLVETAGRGTAGEPAEPPSAPAQPRFDISRSNLLLFEGTR